MDKQVLRHDTHCRLCGKAEIAPVFELRATPLEDQFVSEDHRDIPQPVYPLELALCEACGYVHLPYIVDPEASYSDYIYVSGVTVGLRGHYDDYALEIIRGFNIAEGSLAVDLGSNDGSMLASFKRLGMRVVGVEPAAGIARQANGAGLPTINGFFNDEVTNRILREYGHASVVTANYMYANVDDVLGFTKNVSRLLSPDGIFVVQTGYHPEQMKIRMFDYIYHEHFSYFTLEVIRILFSSCGLEVIHAQKLSPKGGSIRVVGQLKNGMQSVDPTVQEIIDEERRQDMRNPESYRKFAEEIAEAKKQVVDLLGEIKKSGQRIVGFGASHSTTTLIYHFELFPFIEYLVDDNPLKHGTYSPGYHIPVYPSDRLYENPRPDHVIILAWQHGNSIMDRHQKYLANNGHWIVPLPYLRQF